MANHTQYSSLLIKINALDLKRINSSKWQLSLFYFVLLFSKAKTKY